MKRILIVVSILSMALGFTAFDCSSADVEGAKLYIQQERYDKAIEVLQKELQKNPKDDGAYFLLGYVYGEKGEYAKMIDNYDKSLAISDKHKEDIHNSRLRNWYLSFSAGVNDFNVAGKAKDPDSTKALFMKAAEKFKGSIICEPDSSNGYENLAYTYINLRDYDSAIEPLKNLLKLNKLASTYSLLGQIYNDKGVQLMNNFRTSHNVQDSVDATNVFNEEIAILEQGRKDFPDDAEILREIASAYVSANRMGEAKDTFEAGVEKEPNNKYYRYNYGVLLLDAKDFVGAEEQFKKALEIDPDYVNASYNLGVTYVRWGSEMRAAAEAKDTTDESYMDKFKAALPYMEKYLLKNPKEPVVWELIGKIYANLGMSDKSKEAFENADKYR